MGLPSMVMGIETEYSMVFDEHGQRSVKGENRHIQAVTHFRALNVAARTSALVMGPLLRSVVKERLPLMEFLGNGSRFYLDGDHPELSVAECADPKDAVLYDEAGAHIMRALAQASREAGIHCRIYKRSYDGHGHTWGCHENYAISPALFAEVIDDKTHTGYPNIVATFLAVRQLLTGAGKIGPDVKSPRFDFQLSPRADFMLKFHSNNTLQDRAIINQRDEALADESGSKRLHLICGEANRMQWATYLKLALTSALLRMLQDDPHVLLGPLPVFSGDYPQMFRIVSRDFFQEVRYPVVIVHGKRISVQRQMPASEILWWYVQAIEKYLSTASLGDEVLRSSYLAASKKAVWATEQLRAGRWRSLYGVVEWATKYLVVEEYLKRKGRTWQNAVADAALWQRARTLGNLSFTSLIEDVSVYDRLVAAGSIAEVVRPSDVMRAVSEPPSGRAGQRIALAARYVENFTAMDWDRVCFRQPGADILFRLGRPKGADEAGLDNGLLHCPTPMDLAFFLDQYPVDGIRSEVKVHPEESHA